MKKSLYIFCLFFFTTLSFAQKNEKISDIDPDYQIYHDELKTLYIKRIHSEIYIHMKEVHDDYRQKANYQQNKNNVKDINYFGAWVRSNLSKTNFKTVKEADEAWEAYLKVMEDEVTKNHKYKSYLDIVLEKTYGPKLIVRVHSEVMAEYYKLFGLTKKQADGLKEMLRKQQE